MFMMNLKKKQCSKKQLEKWEIKKSNLQIQNFLKIGWVVIKLTGLNNRCTLSLAYTVGNINNNS